MVMFSTQFMKVFIIINGTAVEPKSAKGEVRVKTRFVTSKVCVRYLSYENVSQTCFCNII